MIDGAAMGEGKNMQQGHGGVWVVVSIIAAIGLLPAVAAARWMRRRAEREAAESKASDIPPRVMTRRGWYYVLAIWLLIVVGYQFVGKPVPPNVNALPPAPGNLWIARVFLLFAAVLVAVFLAPVARALWRAWRQRDPEVDRAILKANAGDDDGALADLRALVEARGLSATRATALGAFHFKREQWDEAARMFEEAERLGADKRACAMNRAMIGYRSGHPEEALPVLQELLAENPYDIVLGCNACHILIDLGQMDEARRLLAAVENRHAALFYLSRSQRAAMDRLVEECRARLEQAKSDLSAIDEL
jgi:hypothetical protein